MLFKRLGVCVVCIKTAKSSKTTHNTVHLLAWTMWEIINLCVLHVEAASVKSRKLKNNFYFVVDLHFWWWNWFNIRQIAKFQFFCKAFLICIFLKIQLCSEVRFFSLWGSKHNLKLTHSSKVYHIQLSSGKHFLRFYYKTLFNGNFGQKINMLNTYLQ